jgi:hypothetical protein
VVLEPPKWEIRCVYNHSVAVSQRFWKVLARLAGEIETCQINPFGFGTVLSASRSAGAADNPAKKEVLMSAFADC